MDFLGIGSAISGLANSAVGASATALQHEIALKNYQLDVDKFNYQKELNQLQMDREDKAYQRKVADIVAAGGNPALAFEGAGSVSSPLTSADAPHFDGAGINQGLEMLQNGIGQLGNIERIFLENNAIKENTNKVKEDISRTRMETLLKQEEILLTAANTAKSKAERNLFLKRYDELDYNLEKYSMYGMPTNTQFPTATNFIEKTGNAVQNVLKEKNEKTGLTYGQMASIVASAGLVMLPIGKIAKIGYKSSKTAKQIISRSYDYLKAHGVKGINRNKKDFVDYVLNGIKEDYKEYISLKNKLVDWAKFGKDIQRKQNGR